MILLVLFIFTSVDDAVLAKSNQTKIASDFINVRSGPGLSYEVVDALKRDEQVEVISTSGDWLEVKHNGQTGWIASWLTTSTDESVPAKSTDIIAQTDALNFRENPSVDAAILTRMNAGDTAALISRNGDWLLVQFNGMNGWVYAQYTSEVIAKTQSIDTDDAKNKPKFETFTVSVDTLNVRRNAHQSSKKVGTIHKGKSYPILKIEGNWVQIQINKKKEGWVYSFHGELSHKATSNTTKDTKAQKVTVLTNGTNIRASATTSSDIVSRANAGEQFSIQEEQGDWYKISLKNGETAFIAKWVVSVDETPMKKKKKKKKQVKREPGTLNGLTIIVDPGHGGNDRGTTGARGTLEKTVTLKTAELLASKLQAAGATVHLTRESDHYISLQKRVWTSIEKEADAFISLHYDANIDASIAGFTTYYQHQNQKAFAQTVNHALGSTLTLKNRGAQPADFYVLRENEENAILIELGFLSNPSEELMINSHNFREQASYGIYQGVLNYFNE